MWTASKPTRPSALTVEASSLHSEIQNLWLRLRPTGRAGGKAVIISQQLMSLPRPRKHGRSHVANSTTQKQTLSTHFQGGFGGSPHIWRRSPSYERSSLVALHTLQLLRQCLGYLPNASGSDRQHQVTRPDLRQDLLDDRLLKLAVSSPIESEFLHPLHQALGRDARERRFARRIDIENINPVT